MSSSILFGKKTSKFNSRLSINEYLYEDTDLEVIKDILKEEEVDILCFGHTHKPYHRIIDMSDENGEKYAHTINIGSVGKPKDGDSRGSYVLIEINEESNNTSKELVRVEIRRFRYDIEKAALAVEGSPLPNELADMLRKGY